MVYGLALLAPDYTADITRILPGRMRAIVAFYLSSKYNRPPLLRLGVLEVAPLEAPMRVRASRW